MYIDPPLLRKLQRPEEYLSVPPLCSLILHGKSCDSAFFFFKCRYEESERSYKKYLELKPRHSTAEKELSQLHQAQSALDTAFTLFDSGDYAKSLEYIDKVVLVFSPACSKVIFWKILIKELHAQEVITTS